jgi:hypothetical protein
VKLKDDKTCQKKYLPDHIPDDAEPVHKPCRFGCCVTGYCPSCGLEMGYGWGPIACPHKKNENGTLRWFKYPDMDKKSHVAAKENTMRKQKRSKRSHKS